MRKPKLDSIDRKILTYLQQDGRMTNVELAKRVGISAPPCLRRVKSLEDKGYIRNYYADISLKALGFGVKVFALVKLESQAEKDLVAFEQHVAQFDSVRECHMLAGDTDFMLKIVEEDWESYQEFLKNNLTSAPNVISVKSCLNIRSTKHLPGAPVKLLEEGE